MKIEIQVPSAGESVSEATVARVIKPSGSRVKKGEEILELETDKVNQVVYSPDSGELSLSVSEGQTVKIGQAIGWVNTEKKGESSPSPSLTPSKKIEALPQPPSPPLRNQVRVSMEESLSRLDSPEVVAPLPQPAVKEGGERKKMSGLRKTIAKRLVEVKNQTAMLTTFNEVDMSQVMKIRNQEKDPFEKKYGVKLGFMSFFVKACVSALKAYPDVNARIDGDDIVYYPSADIGVAVSTEKGLFVPVIRGCEKLSFAGIEKAILSFATKAREGKLAIDDLEGGTFTITNGGVFGSLLSTPILNPPQSGILGMHSIVKRPVVVDNEIVIRPMMYIALSYDHRIIDGKEAVGFLVHVKQQLEDPARMLLEF